MADLRAQLDHLFPGAAAKDSSERGMVDPVASCQLTLAHAAFRVNSTNCSDRLSIELPVRVPFAARARGVGGDHVATVLVPHVRDIVSRRPQEEVARVHADRVITRVADVHTISDRSVGQLVGETMRKVRLLEVRSEYPVAIARVTSPEPGPAGVGVVLGLYAHTEPLFDGGGRHTEMVSRAEQSSWVGSHPAPATAEIRADRSRVCHSAHSQYQSIKESPPILSDSGVCG